MSEHRRAAPDDTARGQIVLVAAVAANGVIGAAGGMPWHLPDDLRRFKAVTMGHPMVMGRKTFESIGRPLAGRRSIVVTRDPGWSRDGVEVAAGLGEAIALARRDDPRATVMVVGGGEIYAQAMPLATRLEMTHIDARPPGDTVFPAIDRRRWRPTAREERDGYRWVTYVLATSDEVGGEAGGAGGAGGAEEGGGT